MNFVIFSMSDPMMFHPSARLPRAFGKTEAEAWAAVTEPKPTGLFAREVSWDLTEFTRRKRHAKFCRPHQY